MPLLRSRLALWQVVSEHMGEAALHVTVRHLGPLSKGFSDCLLLGPTAFRHAKPELSTPTSVRQLVSIVEGRPMIGIGEESNALSPPPKLLHQSKSEQGKLEAGALHHGSAGRPSFASQCLKLKHLKLKQTKAPQNSSCFGVPVVWDLQVGNSDLV